MSALIPWKTKKETKLVKAETNEVKELTTIVEKKTTDLILKRNGSIVQVRTKELIIAGKKQKVDPHQLIRMIKRVTQNIGEYKSCEDVYSSVIVTALRKARGDLVSILETEFNIHWEINQDTGESNFFM